ncbi:transposon Tf2-9 polyprotein [Trichonephila clavipes]|nr:transposon Tf2-9 polyprotein [Trichonephila clavipes]
MVVIQFNKGFRGLLDVLSQAQVQVGASTVSGFAQLDEECVNESKRHTLSEEYKQLYRIEKISTCVMEAFRPPAPLQFSLGNMKEKWRKWRQELENYLLGTEKDDRRDKIKIAILVNLLGSEELEIYNTFKLESKANFSEGQTIETYVTQLNALASTCEFAEQENGLIRDRIVLGIKDSELQERLLRENNLNVEKAIEIFRAAETSREQIRNMKYDTATTKFVKENQNKPKTQYNCKTCGRKHKPREYPAFGKMCAKCKKKNHFAAKCFQSTKNIHELNVPENELVYIDSVNENETKCAMKNGTDSNFKNVEMPNGSLIINCSTDKLKNVPLPFYVVNVKSKPILELRGCKELKLIERIDAIECSISKNELSIKPDPDHIKAIAAMPTPKSKTEVRRLLGMMNFLSKFISNVSKVTAPIREIIHENVEFNWGKEQELSFVNIKELLAKAPILKVFSVNDELVIQCDSSKDGLGSCLIQKVNRYHLFHAV